MLRRTLLAAASSERLRQAITTAPQTRAIVDRYVAGETTADAVRVARELRDAGLLVSLDYLGEDTTDAGQAADVARDLRPAARASCRRPGSPPAVTARFP